MAIVRIFHGRVSDDGTTLLLLDDEKPMRDRILRRLAGKTVDLTLKVHREQRSLDQNAYWHAVPFPILQDALGYDSIEELKLALMGECWGYHIDKVTGRELPIKPHTSSMNTEEGAHFTEWMVRFGALLPSPVEIPLPNEAEAA